MNVIIKAVTRCVLVLLLFQTAVYAQIKIGGNPQSLNNDAILEIESKNKGLLLPRVALIDTTTPAPLSKHIAGMTVYNTATSGNVTPGFYYNDGASWIASSSNKPSALVEQFIVQSPTNSFVLKKAPSVAKLYVNGTLIDQNAYSISGNVLTYNNNNNYSYLLSVGDKVIVDYTE